MVSSESDLPSDFYNRLDAVDTALDGDPERALVLAREVVATYPEEPEPVLLLAEAQWQAGEREAARDTLRDLVARDPEYADAHHALGCVYGELGDEAAMVESFLEVRRLDRAREAEGSEDWRAEEQLVVGAAEATLAALPDPFRERLAGVPIFVEDCPSEAMVRESFDPRAFGLFEGRDHRGELDSAPADRPTRIVLYAANLVAEFGTGEELADEVGVTVLHELGHYFGLDEDDLAELGLD